MNMQFTYETSLTHQGNEYYAEVDINITDVVVVKPDHTSWSSDIDYFGTKEMEWEVVGFGLFDEDGNLTLNTEDKKQIAELALDYDKIEAWLWEQLEDMGDDREY